MNIFKQNFDRYYFQENRKREINKRLIKNSVILSATIYNNF